MILYGITVNHINYIILGYVIQSCSVVCYSMLYCIISYYCTGFRRHAAAEPSCRPLRHHGPQRYRYHYYCHTIHLYLSLSLYIYIYTYVYIYIYIYIHTIINYLSRRESLHASQGRSFPQRHLVLRRDLFPMHPRKDSNLHFLQKFRPRSNRSTGNSLCVRVSAHVHHVFGSKQKGPYP